MANAILKLRLSGEWFDPDTGRRETFNFGETRIETAGKRYIAGKRQAIGTSAEAIEGLGDPGVGGLLICQNQDLSNYVEVMTAAAGTSFVRLLKKGADIPQVMRLDNSLTAPAMKANVAACDVDYWYFPV